jgi:hypothetical protein
MIFCSKDRFKKLDPDSGSWFDISARNTRYISLELDPDTKKGRCYAVDYDVTNIQGRSMAITTDSDFFNKGAYLKAPKDTRQMADFVYARPNIADTIDVCTWFLHKSSQGGWPRVSKDRVAQTQEPGFVGGISWYSTPVDGLRSIGLAMLHEVRFSNLRPLDRANDDDPVDTYTPRHSVG